MGGSGSKELKKCPLPSPAVLWFVNVRERKLRMKKESSLHITKKLNYHSIVLQLINLLIPFFEL